MKAQIVSFQCIVRDRLGKILSSSFNEEVINQLNGVLPGANDPWLRGLVTGIQNVHAGERRQLNVPASEAFGHYDPNLVLRVPRAELAKSEGLVIGSELMRQAGPGRPKRAYRVTQIQGENLVLDGNHPFAGQDLVFDIEVVAARDACPADFEEASAGLPDSTRHLH